MAMLGVVFALSMVTAQDYKHPYGLIKEDGKVLDDSRKHIGWVTKDGIIKDITGAKIAYINGEGSLVDAPDLSLLVR
jgi:hypothetical protein